MDLTKLQFDEVLHHHIFLGLKQPTFHRRKMAQGQGFSSLLPGIVTLSAQVCSRDPAVLVYRLMALSGSVAVDVFAFNIRNQIFYVS